MKQWIQKIPFPLLLIFCVIIGLAPFSPEPHLVEKIRMLFQSTLTKPMDIFDLLFHGTPFVLLAAKIYFTVKSRKHNS